MHSHMNEHGHKTNIQLISIRYVSQQVMTFVKNYGICHVVQYNKGNEYWYTILKIAKYCTTFFICNTVMQVLEIISEVF